MLVDPPELAPDLEWMLQSGQVGSKTLIDTITREYYRGAYHLAFSVTGDVQQAQQAVGEAFISAVVTRFRYRAAWGARAWIYRLVWLACRSIKERQARVFPDGCYPSSDGISPDEALLWLQVFRSLRPVQRACLYLAANGIDEQETAFILGMPQKRVIDLSIKAVEQLSIAIPRDVDGNEWSLPLSMPLIPGWTEAERDVWVEQAATEADRQEKRRPIAVLVREFSFFGALIILLAGGYFGAQRFALLPATAPTPRMITRIIRITATSAPTAPPSPTPDKARILAATPPISADGSANSPTSHRIVVSDTITTSVAFSQTIGWSQSGSLGLAGILNSWGLNRPPGEVLTDLQPNPEDQTVMAYELLAYVEDHTPYRAMLRFGGDEVLLARLVEAGFPVMIERYDKPAAGSNWIGRYEVVAGYENNGQFRLNVWMPYQPLTEFFDATYLRIQPGWQALNYNYLLVYPPEREKQLFALLATDADERTNLANATWRASAEIFSVTTDQTRFFAWINYGVSLAYQDDYRGAAQAFDEAYVIYKTLSSPFPIGRLLLYQTRPYWAYYYTGRYQELVQLASDALSDAQGPMPEEGYYWRGLAREALGDMDGAIQDLRQAVTLNPHFEAGLYHLQRMIETG